MDRPAPDAGTAARLAELIAEADYLIAAQPIRPRARRTLHRLRITLGRVVDLTGSTELASLGVDDAALTTRRQGTMAG